MGWVANATHRPIYPWQIPGTCCIGGWVGLRASPDGCGKSLPTPGFDRPARSESLHRLSYPGPAQGNNREGKTDALDGQTSSFNGLSEAVSSTDENVVYFKKQGSFYCR
jgi:hypothetical protein